MTISIASANSFPAGDESLRLSALGKFWRFREAPVISDALLAVAQGSELLAHLLSLRGCGGEETARSFLDAEQYVATSPMELPDVDKAVVRITTAIQRGEKITIYGDYDVDGVTGTSVLLTVLRKLGAVVDFYIPNRSNEGYGLNLKAVSILASKQRTKLIISCDCGVSNFAEINFAKSLGVDTLVLDHHSMPELLPPAVGIVHPKRLAEDHPLFHLPGVGVAYKVCEALLVDRGMDAEVPELLDYVTLGMIADLVPLIRENRYLVKIGLPILINSKRPGIQALLAQVRKSEDTDLVGFGLAPRINAVGRLADAKIAVELLTTDDEEAAGVMAKQLQSDNVRRQELCEQIYLQAETAVRTKIDLQKDRAIVIYDEGWHHGVVGIVASRLVEKFSRPVFIGEFDPGENIVKGSARSIDAIDLYQVLKLNEQLMVKWGGHKMAAGFTVEADKASAWARALTDTCNRMLADNPLNAQLEVEAVVETKDLTEPTADSLAKLAPFGMWNKKPLLCTKSVFCSSSRVIGKEGKHHRIMIDDTQEDRTFECVMWNSRGNVPHEGQEIDIVFTPEINTFNGRKRLQLLLTDWRDSKTVNLAAAPSLQSPTVTTGAMGAAGVAPPMQVMAGTQTQSQLSTSSQAQPLVYVAPDPILEPSGRNLAAITAQKLVWKDLRSHDNPNEIMARAASKLGASVNFFAEIAVPGDDKYVDRLSVVEAPHLVICQFPASQQIFQDLLAKTGATSIYLLGGLVDDNGNESTSFLRKLLGLVKYAINKREGQVHGDKLAALMGSTKMSIALGLTILKKINIIDWFSEEGCIYLDILGAPIMKPDEVPEYKQLDLSLNAAQDFRDWCRSVPLKEIQLGLMPNSIGLGLPTVASDPDDMGDDDERIDHGNEHSNGQEHARSGPSA